MILQQDPVIALLQQIIQPPPSTYHLPLKSANIEEQEFHFYIEIIAK